MELGAPPQSIYTRGQFYVDSFLVSLVPCHIFIIVILFQIPVGVSRPLYSESHKILGEIETK